MLLTISTTHSPATDLGYLLHKHPDRYQAIELRSGNTLTICFPEKRVTRCTMAARLGGDIRSHSAPLFLGIAIAEAFHSALLGRSVEKAKLASTAIPLEARVHGLTLPETARLASTLFSPLGYRLEFGEDSEGTWIDLSATKVLSNLLKHLCLLLPVLGHISLSSDERRKLLRHGKGWLNFHPEIALLARIYPSLTAN